MPAAPVSPSDPWDQATADAAFDAGMGTQAYIDMVTAPGYGVDPSTTTTPPPGVTTPPTNPYDFSHLGTGTPPVTPPPPVTGATTAPDRGQLEPVDFSKLGNRTWEKFLADLGGSSNDWKRNAAYTAEAKTMWSLYRSGYQQMGQPTANDPAWLAYQASHKTGSLGSVGYTGNFLEGDFQAWGDANYLQVLRGDVSTQNNPYTDQLYSSVWVAPWGDTTPPPAPPPSADLPAAFIQSVPQRHGAPAGIQQPPRGKAPAEFFDSTKNRLDVFLSPDSRPSTGGVTGPTESLGAGKSGLAITR